MFTELETLLCYRKNRYCDAFTLCISFRCGLSFKIVVHLHIYLFVSVSDKRSGD